MSLEKGCTLFYSIKLFRFVKEKYQNFIGHDPLQTVQMPLDQPKVSKAKTKPKSHHLNLVKSPEYAQTGQIGLIKCPTSYHCRCSVAGLERADVLRGEV